MLGILLILGVLGDNCTNTDFSKELELLQTIDYGFDLFNNYVPIEKHCEYAEPINYQSMDDFNCSRDECLRWCSYDTTCKYSLFSNKTNLCSRSIDLITSDNYKMSKEFFNNEIQIYRRNTAFPRFYSQLCNSYISRKRCNRSKQCRWNRGKEGYNKETFLTGKGYCGRIKCF